MSNEEMILKRLAASEKKLDLLISMIGKKQPKKEKEILEMKDRLSKRTIKS